MKNKFNSLFGYIPHKAFGNKKSFDCAISEEACDAIEKIFNTIKFNLVICPDENPNIKNVLTAIEEANCILNKIDFVNFDADCINDNLNNKINRLFGLVDEFDCAYQPKSLYIEDNCYLLDICWDLLDNLKVLALAPGHALKNGSIKKLISLVDDYNWGLKDWWDKINDGGWADKMDMISIDFYNSL